MVKVRAGRSGLGCLLTGLLVVLVAYYGINVGEVYYRYYRFRDALLQEGRLARQNTDDEIKLRLKSLADSLGLPEEAGRIMLRRSANRIVIATEYEETVTLPLFVRTFSFAPSYAGGL